MVGAGAMNAAEIVSIAAALTSLVASVTGLVVALSHAGRITSVEHQVNGVTAANVELAQQLGQAKGELVGRDHIPVVPQALDRL